LNEIFLLVEKKVKKFNKTAQKKVAFALELKKLPIFAAH